MLTWGEGFPAGLHEVPMVHRGGFWTGRTEKAFGGIEGLATTYRLEWGQLE